MARLFKHIETLNLIFIKEYKKRTNFSNIVDTNYVCLKKSETPFFSCSIYVSMR